MPRTNTLLLGLCTLAVAMGLLSANASVARADATNTSQDFAPVASTEITVDGPVDSTFHALELRVNRPLTSTHAWHGFDRQSGRDITLDLVYDRPLQSISIEMEQDPRHGVYYPSHVDFDINVGGQWYSLGSVHTSIPNTDHNLTTQTFSVNCNNIESHLVRIHFPVPYWVYARHLQVIGNSFALPGVQTLPDLPKAPSTFSQPLLTTDDRSNGIHNMLLVYTGANAAQGTWTSKDFLPMTSYMLSDGSVGGRLFDTFAFLPYAQLPQTETGWQAYLNDLFAPNSQLAALDAAAQQTETGLKKFGGNSSIQEKVIFTLPYPKYGSGDWGQINGVDENFAGSSTDLDAVAARTAALNWYVNALLTQWKAANFSHLQLAGLYWLNESVAYTSPGDVALIQNMQAVAQQQQLPLFWIPYYDAPGLADWQTLGFSAAWIQPNYMELGAQADLGRLANSEALAKANGLGIEVEAPWQVLSYPGYRSMYAEAITQMERSGYGELVSHVFYAGSKVLSTAAYSTNASVRAVYDETYGLVTYP